MLNYCHWKWRAVIFSNIMALFFGKGDKMSKSIHEINIGDQASLKRVFTREQVEDFAELTFDKNPAHMDEEYAKASIFKDRIVHGMFVATMFSTIFGMDFPGVGSIYTKQSLAFKRPVYFGDEITAMVTVTELNLERNRVVFDCQMTNQKGEIVLVGSAEIMPPVK